MQHALAPARRPRLDDILLPRCRITYFFDGNVMAQAYRHGASARSMQGLLASCDLGDDYRALQ
jgi:hypothetical protein